MLSRGTLLVLHLFYAAAFGTRLSTFEFGAARVQVEQEFTGAEEGSVVWDASRALLAHIAFLERKPIAGCRVLEIGSGTGLVGLALARLGAASVVLTDKDSQVPLLKRNVERNQPSCCADRCNLCAHIGRVDVLPLVWGDSWQTVADTILSERDAWDLIVCCDCVYPDRPSDLATVLLDLMALNRHATLLLAFEKRPPPASAPPGTDHTRDFFEAMRAGCEVEQVPDEELDPAWKCDEITLWRLRIASDENDD